MLDRKSTALPEKAAPRNDAFPPLNVVPAKSTELPAKAASSKLMNPPLNVAPAKLTGLVEKEQRSKGRWRPGRSDESDERSGSGDDAERQLHQVEECLGVEASLGFDALHTEQVPSRVEHGAGPDDGGEEREDKHRSDAPQAQA
ncbi:hypothetical protein ACFXGT_33760 [Streptomyces sp. NPDC059352]|uniref:hypothetical protein n=1 Tax=Streptomyces sp. NPDC059352 TaxID=3346810 RepID=UPI00368391DA